MNGDCNVSDNNNRRERSSNEKEKATSESPQEFTTASSGRPTKRKKRKTPNSLSVESSTAKSKPADQRVLLKKPGDGDGGGGSSTDAETSSLFTTTSEITSEDDAASIEIRLKRLVVEQEEKLGLDDRYRSTPVLAHRVLHHDEDKVSTKRGDRNELGCAGGGTSASAAAGSGSPMIVRAKSTNDLAAIVGGGASELVFNFDHLPAAAAANISQVPDVFVIQVDDVEERQRRRQSEREAKDGDENFTDCQPSLDRAVYGLSSSSNSSSNSNNNNNDNTPHRVRALSIACSPPIARCGSNDSSQTGEGTLSGFMRRNVSSSYLPERGNLRTLNSNRAAGATNESAAAAAATAVRNRSNTAGSMDKSAMFTIGYDNQALEDADQSMLSIQRSAWTLSDFDQTFNKSALAEQQKKANDGSVSAANTTTTTTTTGAADHQIQQKGQQNSAEIQTRGNIGLEGRHSNSLLKKASKNAMAGLNQQHRQAADNSSLVKERRFSLSINDQSDRRPSFSHSIVSIPSSIDSNTQVRLNPFKSLKHRPSFSAGQGGDEGEKRSCLRSCMNLNTFSRYLPILEWLPNYKLSTFYSDLGSSFVVAALNISICLSAAVVAETDFGAAFRGSIVNTFIYAILCSSKHASFGSWSILSQMMLLSVNRALKDEIILDQLNMGPSASWEPEEYEKWHMNIIIMYTFMIGVIQLICGLLNLGNILSSFIPEALCSSVVVATAFTMSIGQLANMCGTSNKILWQIERNTTELWADLNNPRVDITDLFANTFRWIQQIILLAKHYDQINIACVIISSTSVILLFLNQNVIQQYLERLFKRKILVPFEMLLIIIMVLVSYALNLSEDYNVTTCGPISIEFGIPNIPNLKLVRELWFDALATALISYTMVYVMAKTYSNKLNYEVNYNQELIACGAGNLIGGLFDALPATATFSRTAGQVDAGGQTQMVSIINCVILVVSAMLLGQYVSVLPICVASTALFYGFTRMMTRFTEVFKYWRVCKVDWAIWVVTFVAILAVDLVNGFIFGFVFSLITMLYRAQNRRCYMLGTIGSSDVYVPLVKYPMAQEVDGIKIFQFCGPIHYVCADLVERLLRQKTRVNVKEVLRYISEQGIDKFNPRDQELPTHIILDFSMISFIDSAGIHVIKKIIEDYQKINVVVLLASLASHVATVVKSEPSLWNVHKQRFYITLADAVHCALRDRMKQLGGGGGGIGARVDVYA